jgi:hypothetical protein
MISVDYFVTWANSLCYYPFKMLLQFNLHFTERYLYTNLTDRNANVIIPANFKHTSVDGPLYLPTKWHTRCFRHAYFHLT